MLKWPVALLALMLAMPAHAQIVIAHRGASALRPEHTLAAYRQAIEDGADFIEPDLVMSRDGVLVARHECELGRSSDVAAHPEFAPRRTRRRIDGEWIEGWFCEDFSLEELRRLRAREPMPELRGTQHDGLDAFQVQQMREHQSGRPGADDSDLRAHRALPFTDRPPL